jgi:tripartite-type tricarboxylate transporter receptor subunit TctC
MSINSWFCAATLAVLLAPSHASAQDPAADYPNRPVRLIIPQTPGAASDILTRIFANKLGETLGTSFVIDNRAGAGGIIGAEAGAKANPDGYTILTGASAWITISPHTYKKLPYDALNDLIPISVFAQSQAVLIVNPASGVTNVRELIALMKDKPNQINMASAGIGSNSHLAGILLTALSGTTTVHVPYKGAGPSVASVMTGESLWSFTPMQAPLGFIRQGKLRAIAVSATNRSPALPNVPTAAESGIPDYEHSSWYGLMAPKGTPTAIINKLHAAIVKAVNAPDLREQILNQGAEPISNTPAEFAKYIRQDFEMQAKIVKLAGLKVD